MAVQKLTIEDFLLLAKQHPVFDVRSPGEYVHAHIPNAISLPLFTDEERKVVGTAYKQQSKQTAIKIGLDYFGTKMRSMVEEVEKITAPFSKENNKSNASVPPLGGGGGTVLVHCWRGGMRSAGVAWLLDLYGFKVYTLVGGYKAYRKWVLAQFEKEYAFRIIGGYTGSGKTGVLQQLAQKHTIIDLEALANHKGSAFGGLDGESQPRQEMFENLLAQQLADASPEGGIWLEDESQRIGNLQIPMPLWYTMRKSPVYFIDVPFEERLDHITAGYGQYSKEKLVNAIIRIQKRLGGLDTKNAVNYLLEDNYRECFRLLLSYYDKQYNKALANRENLAAQLNKIACSGVDTVTNTQNILACLTVTA
ncbi:tRNA 2-selenouridine(34) synthase MnmH [Ferruginibacter sp.]